MPKKKVADSVRTDQAQNIYEDVVDTVAMDPSVAPMLAALVSQAQQQGSISATELVGGLLSLLASAERRTFLAHNESDRANGFYERTLSLGTLPTTINVPRTRSGNFRPNFLPPRYRRSLPGISENLLAELLMASTSTNALNAALKSLGVSAPADEIEEVQRAYAEELHLLNSSQLDTDYLAIWLDGKHTKVRIDDRILKAVIYVIIGMTTTGHKRILYCNILPGSESKDQWRNILQDLIRRGLRRVLTIIHDDLSGLSKLIASLFPLADDQLCLVHVQRNIRRRMSADHASTFNRRLRAIGQSSDTSDRALEQFNQLCDQFQDEYPKLITELRKKSGSLFSFLLYPPLIRSIFYSTNVVESFNSQLAKQIANSGGYFQSDKIAASLLGMRVISLHQGKWARPLSRIVPYLPLLNSLIFSRYEDDSEGLS